MKIKNHYFNLPLDYSYPDKEQLNIFVREVFKDTSGVKLPYLVYFQGGPGYESPRPITETGWLKYALKYYRVLLLDQRGTGKSSPICKEDYVDLELDESAYKVSLYRADNIVRDAEEIRKRLIGSEKWSLLGQSFGGFCSTHYLSFYQNSLDKVFITGGLPPLDAHPDEIYRRTYKRVISKNKLFYQQFPEAKNNVLKIVDHLRLNKVILPNGEEFTVQRFQQLGLNLGFSDGLAILNYLFEDAFSKNKMTYTFLKNILTKQSFDTNPIFTILHEACYAQKFSTNWSAYKIKNEFNEYNNKESAFHFTGEMLYPWMMDEYKELRPFKEVANRLAEKDDWPILYSSKTLKNNKVPTAAAVYTNDMYVDREYSMETASKIKNIKVWETDQLEHNGLRSSGELVLKTLFKSLDKNL